jgi:hypothetical protein
MKVLVSCECSGRVRDAFNKKGHDAWSCDIQPSETPTDHHYQCNVLELIPSQSHEDYSEWYYEDNWDLLIAHPPCTYLCSAGARWMYDPRYPTRKQDRDEAICFFMMMVNAGIPKIAVENPQGIMSTVYRKPDQYIQPYQFGHMEQKRTGLWLKGLPKLYPKNNVYEEMMKLPRNQRERVHYMWGNINRSVERSRTYEGIAAAMADQWG